MTHKNFLTKLLLLLLSILLLVSCTNVVLPTPEESISQEESGKTESQIIEEILSQLPSVETSEMESISGQPFIILTPNEKVFYGEETTAGSIQNALQRRNELLRSAYQMEINVVPVREDEILETLTAAAESGIAAGDLLCFSAKTTATLFAAGLLQDLDLLPYFDSSTACADPVAAKTLSYGKEVYALPDATAQSANEAYVVYYDRELIQKTQLTRPESLVQSGSWTYEAFLEYSQAVAKTVMNSASHDLGKDVFGYSSPDNTNLLPYLLWSCSGKPLFSFDENNLLSFSYDAITLQGAVTMQRGIYSSKSRYPLDGTSAHAAFMTGRLGFLIERLEYLKELYAKSKRSYGILPMPKERGASDYTCPVTTEGRVLSAPKLMNSPSKTGLGLSALCTTGGLLIRQAEKETYVTLYSADNDQSCMLEIILDSQYFDFATVFGGCDPSITALSTDMFGYMLVDNSTRIPTLIQEGKDALAAYALQLQETLHPAVDILPETSTEESGESAEPSAEEESETPSEEESETPSEEE